MKAWTEELEELTFYKESDLQDLSMKISSTASSPTKKKIECSTEKENTFLPLQKSSTKVSPIKRVPFKQGSENLPLRHIAHTTTHQMNKNNISPKFTQGFLRQKQSPLRNCTNRAA